MGSKNDEAHHSEVLLWWTRGEEGRLLCTDSGRGGAPAGAAVTCGLVQPSLV